MSAKDRDDFLLRASEAVNNWSSGDRLAHSEIAKRIEKMEECAKAMQRAIEQLKGHPFEMIRTYYEHNLHREDPFFELPDQIRYQKIGLDRVLENAWEMMQVLRDTGEFARPKIKLSKNLKPATIEAQKLVYAIAEAYHYQFKEYPPTDRASWFPEFMTRLGEILKLKEKFGFSMIASVIKGMKR